MFRSLVILPSNDHLTASNRLNVQIGLEHQDEDRGSCEKCPFICAYVFLKIN